MDDFHARINAVVNKLEDAREALIESTDPRPPTRARHLRHALAASEEAIGLIRAELGLLAAWSSESSP